MASAKQLLLAQNVGSVFKGKAFIDNAQLVHKVVQGMINPRATYIQTFDSMKFHGVEPDIVFVTARQELCYLYQVE